MANRPHGRARVDPSSPRAWGTCDRCGFNYNLEDLLWQWDYNGAGLYNKQIRVCTVTCMDEAQPQLLARTLPPDPVPVDDPRPEPYSIDEA